MKGLKPVDFKAVAAKGAFVYCYLRHSDSKTAAAYTPYYVGLAQVARRPFGHHGQVPVPADKCLVRVLKSGLTLKEAEAWEQFYIFWFGRELDGGILLNQKLGGEAGGCGNKMTAEWVANHCARMKGNQHTKGRKLSAEHKKAISDKNKGQDNTKATAVMIANENKRMAKKYGVTLESWTSLSIRDRKAVYTRYSRGVRGADLFVDASEGRVQRAADTKKAKTAQRYGIPEEYITRFVGTSDRIRSRIRARFNAGRTGYALIEGIEWA